jgi:hypothetical protein
MKRPIVFCSNCQHGKPDPNATWNLRCHNPEVNRADGWALGSPYSAGRGTECTTERRKTGWFAVCGIKGKQYEEKQ